MAGALAALVPGGLYAQTPDAPEGSKGSLTGGYEANVIYYTTDGETNAIVPGGDHVGSNNYLKLNYTKGSFSAGVQMEAYLPGLYGYPTELDGIKITGYYAKWRDRNIGVTAGTFYDQFGSGLLFRSWEDRAMGINNSLTGAHFTYNLSDWLGVKALWGKPRLGMELAEAQVRGADLSMGLSELFNWNSTSLFIEASVLNKYQSVPLAYEDEIKPNITGWSGRMNFEAGGFSASAEYVDNGTAYYAHNDISNPGRSFYGKRGNAQLVELGYTGGGVGAFVSARRLEWMDARFDRNSSSIANVMAYIPAATQQYTYMLTNLHPYSPITGDMLTSISGEIGAQADIFYNARRKSALGGKRGLKLHANFSTYYTLAAEGSARAGNMLFRDLSVDAEKQLSGKLKLTLLYSLQERNLNYGAGKATALAHIAVADILYKFTSSFSIRGEVQYLHTKEDDRDWIAALVELNMAPNWSVYASDMYNHGSTKVHYYNVGVSYARSRTRIALSWGRNRAGYVCSGGVCRLVPAYTGGNLSVTVSF